MVKPQLVQIIIRILFIVVNGILVFVTYSKGYLVNTIGFSLVFIFQIFLYIDYVSKLFIDIEKSLDCLLFDDYSNAISAKKRKDPLHNKMALLLEKQRKKNLLKNIGSVNSYKHY